MVPYVFSDSQYSSSAVCLDRHCSKSPKCRDDSIAPIRPCRRRQEGWREACPLYLFFRFQGHGVSSVFRSVACYRPYPRARFCCALFICVYSSLSCICTPLSSLSLSICVSPCHSFSFSLCVRCSLSFLAPARALLSSFISASFCLECPPPRAVGEFSMVEHWSFYLKSHQWLTEERIRFIRVYTS